MQCMVKVKIEASGFLFLEADDTTDAAKRVNRMEALSLLSHMTVKPSNFNWEVTDIVGNTEEEEL